MVRYIFASILIIFISYSCKTAKVPVQVEESKCDLNGKLLLTNRSEYNVDFFDLNSEYQISTTNRENQSVYQFQFLGNQIFDEYELIFQAMRTDGSIIEPFVVPLKLNDRFALNVNGDKLFTAYVRLDDLANKVKPNSGNDNIQLHDFVYRSDWKISVRGKVCGHLGPKSEPRKIILKC